MGARLQLLPVPSSPGDSWMQKDSAFLFHRVAVCAAHVHEARGEDERWRAFMPRV